jgi:hypothetical protein
MSVEAQRNEFDRRKFLAGLALLAPVMAPGLFRLPNGVDIPHVFGTNGYRGNLREGFWVDFGKNLLPGTTRFHPILLTRDEKPKAEESISNFIGSIKYISARLPEAAPFFWTGYSLSNREAFLAADRIRTSGDPRLKDALKRIDFIAVAPHSNELINATRHQGAFTDLFKNRLDMRQIAQSFRSVTIIKAANDTAFGSRQCDSLAEEMGVTAKTVQGSHHFDKPEYGRKVAEFVNDIIGNRLTAA